jgi:hypothetical protein
MAMKILKVYQAQFGQAFFKDERMLDYVHENDNPLNLDVLEGVLEAFDIEVEVLEHLTKEQAKQLVLMENADLDTEDEEAEALEDDDDFDDDDGCS